VYIVAAAVLAAIPACAPTTAESPIAPAAQLAQPRGFQQALPPPILHVVPIFDYPGGNDGVDPVPVLSGNPTQTLYGVTTDGGAPGLGLGVVYSLTPPAVQGDLYTETVLHTFTGPDGAHPAAGLFPIDITGSGTLFGTTKFGGAFDRGTVYEISTDGMTFKTIYSFQGGSDGAVPSSLLETDSAGNLYGTTLQGGLSGCGATSCCPNRCGTVFELVHNPDNTYTEQIIYRFKWGTDGWYPFGTLGQLHGVFYGTTLFGGNSECAGNPNVVPGGQGCGTIYRLQPGANGFTETVLHRFVEGADGNRPLAHMIHIGGTFYGTTLGGGSPACVNGCGTVFKFATAGGTYSVIHRFQGGPQGGQPRGGLTIFNGTLYGTTISGGNSLPCGFTTGCGVMYGVTPQGMYSVLCIVERPNDGLNPQTTVFHGPQTTALFGSTLAGGLHGFGKVFQFDGITSSPPSGKTFC
jgi:uncharacterized repeat protein (TIGR03803 family)